MDEASNDAPAPSLFLDRESGIRFPLGEIVATPGAMAAIEGAQLFLRNCLAKHARGEWGDLCADDIRANEWAVHNGARILSAYRAGSDRIWIITEADRSSTTVLLPDEY